MPSELQIMIDDLAEQLHAPAVLEDRDQRTVVYSAHGETGESIDDLRRQSILRHRADPSALAWFRQFGIFRSTEPVRIPPHPERRILRRLCVPVRHRGRLLGFCWFIDGSDRLGPAQITSVAPILARLSALMYDEEMNRRSTDRLTSRLLSPWEGVRRAAAREIAEDGGWPAGAPLLAVVVQPLGVPSRQARDAVDRALRDLFRTSASSADDGPRLVRRDHAVLLVRTRSLDDDEPGLTRAVRVRRALLDRLTQRPFDPADTVDPASPASRPGPADPADTADGSVRVVVGIGEPVGQLTDAVESYRHARLSVRVAARVPSVGDVCRWRRLGAFRVLAQLPSDEVAAALDPRVAGLLRDGGPDVVRTLETYLDLACDAKATAERLYLHRATLYYRLDKVQRLTGLDLHNGDDRLAIHLSLKLSRLTDLHPNPG